MNAEPALDDLRRQLRGLLALSDASRRIFSAPDPDRIVEACFSALSAVTPGAGRALFLRTADGVDFACRASEGHPARPGDLVALPMEAVDRICAQRRYLILPDPDPDPDRKGVVAVVPLSVADEVVGLLELRVAGNQPPSPRVLGELQILCGQMGAALQNILLRERLDAERRELARTGALLHDILESINHGILTLDAEGRVAMANRNAGLMLRADAAALQGKGYREAFDPDIVAVLDGVVAQTREQGFALDQQVSRKGEGGAALALAIGGAALLDAQGRSSGVIVVCRDMTATKELERLRALDRMKSQFVSNVSHELRTPLTSIKAYADALSGMVHGETARKFLKVVDEESDRLLGMIEDLLNVSRIESGKFRLQWEAADVKALLESVLDVSRVQSRRHRLAVSIAPGTPPRVIMDRNRMKEVLINLVSNAVKYSPEGGEVRIQARFEEGNLRLDVVDRGMGLSAEDQKKLFQVFFRSEQAQAAQIRGTGLGLAITKGIMEAHGGAIRVASDGAGKGSMFTVLLPARQAPPEEAVEAAS